MSKSFASYPKVEDRLIDEFKDDNIISDTQEHISETQEHIQDTVTSPGKHLNKQSLGTAKSHDTINRRTNPRVGQSGNSSRSSREPWLSPEKQQW